MIIGTFETMRSYYTFTAAGRSRQQVYELISQAYNDHLAGGGEKPWKIDPGDISYLTIKTGQAFRDYDLMIDAD